MGQYLRADLYLIALAILAGQLAFAMWWLKRHEQGPFEALWRRGTYGGGRALDVRPQRA